MDLAEVILPGNASFHSGDGRSLAVPQQILQTAEQRGMKLSTIALNEDRSWQRRGSKFLTGGSKYRKQIFLNLTDDAIQIGGLTGEIQVRGVIDGPHQHQPLAKAIGIVQRFLHRGAELVRGTIALE